MSSVCKYCLACKLHTAVVFLGVECPFILSLHLVSLTFGWLVQQLVWHRIRNQRAKQSSKAADVLCLMQPKDVQHVSRSSFGKEPF